ncbi:fimbrial protein [Enterobacter asburiae]|uniref:fimbrial protein n=1 Tax=Enterobacter asburiae TaxID=61645 RepID=UPI0020063A5C|nr:fimbrial protein [Enterobacter asburiae]MCK6688199.1 fimbrial protein [Enterobacter asburiae]MCK7061994.1 fimbrial protein [Enterobacter asburiae]MCK7283906.1 fimbrial protein [Enterobacter asburiae]MCK7403862.1 fimbrial protein [Enterobacter asburiae]MCK7418351.1 fimbrial protein [Enterobacter asburiae]
MSKLVWPGMILALAVCQLAVADQNTAIIAVKVTINATPCEINGNQNIDVDFGDNVITTDVAKGSVEKDVKYTLDCTNADKSKTLVMRISGAGASFDNNVLKTSIPELGIKLKADGVDYPVNTELVLASSSSKPALKALLVQQPGAHLPTGGFNASATMTVDYQ